jgi:hypothetical protein
MNLYQMDFSSSIEECEHKIEINVLNSYEINSAILNFKEWERITKEHQDEIENIMHAENSKYESFIKTFNFANESYIEIFIHINKMKQ